MPDRTKDPQNQDWRLRLEALSQALVTQKSPKEMAQFLEDLCTPAELRTLADRWRVVGLLEKGFSYRDIYDQTGISTATVTRVARAMAYGEGGYRKALDRILETKNASE